MGFGAEFLDNGQYTREEFDGVTNRYVLKKGADKSKDQSYFLHSLSQEQLARAMFPMSDMTKAETRKIARDLGLKVHDKPESQDVCFVGPDGYASFISEHADVGAELGHILDESGSVIGTHRGLHHYTVGQRRGLGISFPEPMYVVDIDPVLNSITVAPRNRILRQERGLLDAVSYICLLYTSPSPR